MITITDLKTWLDITGSSDDARVARAVAGAEQQVRRWCARSFDQDEDASARVFVPTHPGVVFTDDFWTDEDLAVALDSNGDGTFDVTLDTDNLVLEPALSDANPAPFQRIRPRPGTRLFTGHVRVTARWGWEQVPADVTHATLIQASRLYKRKDSPEGVAGFTEMGGVTRISVRMDPDVQMLLEPYRKEPVVI